MKQFIVKEIPKTNLEISNFEMQEVDIPKPSSDEILIKNILLSIDAANRTCLLYTSPSPRDKRQSRMPSSA